MKQSSFTQKFESFDDVRLLIKGLIESSGGSFQLHLELDPSDPKQLAEGLELAKLLKEEHREKLVLTLSGEEPKDAMALDS